MIRHSILMSFAILSAVVTGARSQALPNEVSTRVGRAATFVYAFTPYQYQHRLSDFDFVWTQIPTNIQGGYDKLYFPPAVMSGGYVPVNRIPASAYLIGTTSYVRACRNAPLAGGCTTEWLQENHPTWIIYKADQVTPSYQFGNTGWVPLDITNPDVQAWLLANYYSPILDLGYEALTIDNVTAQNDFEEVGTCSIKPITNCMADGGTWTEIYAAARYNNAAFVAARVAWGKAVTAWAHARGVTTVANITYVPTQPADTASLIAAYDMWYDEYGVSSADEPSPCALTARSSGAEWIAKVAFITGLNGGNGPNGYISENSVCPHTAPYRRGEDSTFEMVEYVVATYMLIKNAHTYLAMFFSTGPAPGGTCGPAAYCLQTSGASWPHFFMEHGLPNGPYSIIGNVYHRTFTDAVALVNPSPSAYTYDLGASVYYRFDCSRWAGVITVPKESGMVLLNREAPSCRVP